jgi:hypothetical protein
VALKEFVTVNLTAYYDAKGGHVHVTRTSSETTGAQTPTKGPLDIEGVVLVFDEDIGKLMGHRGEPSVVWTLCQILNSYPR